LGRFHGKIRGNRGKIVGRRWAKMRFCADFIAILRVIELTV
jgi:hypothetical protein